MEEPGTPAPASSRGGFSEEVRLFFAALSSYLQARLELAGLESKEAAVQYLKAAAFVALALFGLLFGYVFLVIGVVVVIASLTGWAVGWVVCAAALLHLAVAAGGGFLAWGAFRVPQFQTTLAQFEHDRKWLSRHE